jgi:type I restriction enzyme M protein
LAENGDYNLSADRYREVTRNHHKDYPMVALGDERYFTIESGGTPDSKNEDYWNGDVYWATLVDLPADDHISIITDTQRKITQKGLKNSSAKVVPPDSVIVSSRATIGRVGINKVPLATNQGFKNIVIKDRNSADTMFVAFMAKKLAPEMEACASGGTFKEITKTNFSKLQIPLPPVEIQHQIVDEIAAHQRIIDGARQVVEGWKPNLELELAESLPEGVDEWNIVKLSDICEINPESGLPSELFGDTDFTYVDISSVDNGTGHINYENIITTKEAPSRARRIVRKYDVILSTVRPNLKAFAFVSNPPKKIIASTGFAVLRATGKIESKYLYLAVCDDKAVNQMIAQMGKGSYPSINQADVEVIKISLPPLEIQREIVARIESERAVVEGNRELIWLYEEKVKKVIERVWES